MYLRIFNHLARGLNVPAVFNGGFDEQPSIYKMAFLGDSITNNIANSSDYPRFFYTHGVWGYLSYYLNQQSVWTYFQTASTGKFKVGRAGFIKLG